MPGTPSEVDGIPIVAASSSAGPSPGKVPTTCPARFTQIIARNSDGAKITSSRQPLSELLICTYKIHSSAAPVCVDVSIQLNTMATAYTDFNRWTVEAGQNSMWGNDPALQPVPVSGVGTLAEWAPALTTFETTTLSAWVAVFLTCHRPSDRYRPYAQALAEAGLAAIR